MANKSWQTPEFQALLQAGYQMTLDEARTIIKERDEDPVRWPLNEYTKAKALLAAWDSQPRAISKDPGWKRQRIPIG